MQVRSDATRVRLERWFAAGRPIDLAATAASLGAGFGDPTQRASASAWLRATRTPDGPATLAIVREPEGLRVRAYGDGAEAALTAAPAWLGLESTPPVAERLPPRLRRLARRAAGVRLARAGAWIEPLFVLVLAQKVSGKEAARSHRALVRVASEPAPGPDPSLWLPPDPARVARLPDWAFAPLGVDRRRGTALRAVAADAQRIEGLRGLPVAEVLAALTARPGIGAWTATSLLAKAAGEPDVLPIGDLHLPSMVAWNLADERRADDARMLELLAPYRGLRGWVYRWIEAAGEMPPRRAPRAALRPLPPGRHEALRDLRRFLSG